MNLLISAAGTLDGTVGGGQVYVQNLLRSLAVRGHRVWAVSEAAWEGGDEPYRVSWDTFEGIEVANVSINPRATTPAQRWTGLSRPLLAALGEVLRRVEPELIHANGLKPALTKLAVESSVPLVITAHHGGVACPAGALLRPDNSICQLPMSAADCPACYCRQLQRGSRLGKGLGAIPPALYRPIGRVLNVLPDATYAGRTLMYPWLVERSVEGKRYAIQNAAHWIAPSQAIGEVLERNGAQRSRIHVVPHGIEPLPHVPLEGIGSRPVRFGYVGQINRPKGVHVLLRAFARLPRGCARLELIGAPQRADEYVYFDMAMRAVAGREDVHLRGVLPHHQIPQAMAQIDVLILPAIYLEVFGLVVLEAFSVGRPVIVTGSGGPAEIVRDGVDGLVVAPNDVDQLSTAMRSLADRPERIAELAANIEPVRTLEQHAADVEGIYRQALVSSAAPKDEVPVEA